jgi:hypothetical protein
MADTGTRCPLCNCQHTKVLKTFYRNVRWGGKQHIHTRRRRECQRCYHPFWTIETIEDPNNIGFPDSQALPPEKKRSPPSLSPKTPNPYIKDDKFNVIHPDDRDEEPKRHSQ